MADKKQRIIYEAISNLGVVVTDLSKIIELQKQQLQTAKDASTAVVDAINQQKTAYADITKQFQAFKEETTRANNESIAQQKALRDETTKTANQARTDAKNQADAVRQSNASYAAMQSTLSGISSLLVTVFSISQVKAFINDIIDAKSKVDNFKNTLLSMGDSVSMVDNVSLAIQKLDERSAYTSEQLYKTATALRANSIPSEDLIDKLTMLGTVSALVGENKLPLIAKAYLDVRNKQVLMAQEIRQFIENGVPLYDLLATSMDKPKQAVIDMAKAHQISFADVEKALKESTEKGGIYYGALETKAKSLQGQVANLSASFFYGQKNIADYFEVTLQKGIGIIKDFIDASLGSDKAISRTIEYVKAGIAVWLSYQTAQIALNAALKANQAQTLLNMEAQVADNGLKVVGTGITTSLSAAVSGLNLAIRANPFGFALSALTLLIGGFYTYKAITTEVTEAQNEEINSLNKLKVGFQTQLQAIASTTVGTEERTQAVMKMKALYPEYLTKIDLETAGTNELHKALDLANIQLERKIRLATANAQVDLISKKALDIENERYSIILKLRETYKDLSSQFLNDANFISALNSKVLKEQIEIRGEYGELITTTDKGTKEFLKNYADLGTQSRETYKEIERVTINASMVARQVQKEDYAELRRQLRNKQISVEEYNKAVFELDEQRRNKNKNAEDENDTVINKNKKTKASLTANEIKLIELQGAKDTFENRKKILETELKIDIERVNKRFGDSKEAQVKANKEITQLVKEFNANLADMQDDHERYIARTKIESDEKTRNRIEIEANQSFIELAKLDEQYLKKIEKQKTDHEKRVDDLQAKIDEARKKKADALLMLEEINTAKTATEKYQIILKYGRKTDDEVTELSLARWKKDEKAQTAYVKFLSESGEDWKDEYQKQQEILLALRLKILNAETKGVIASANEQMQIYKKNYEVYKAFMADTFKLTSEVFDNMRKVTSQFLDDSVALNRRAYQRQYDLLEGNTEARIQLAKDYAQKEEELLIGNARFQKFTFFLSALSKSFGEYYDKQVKAHEAYSAKVAEIENMTVSDSIKNDLKQAASSQEKLQKISGAVTIGLDVVSSYMEFTYNQEMKQLDAQLQNIRNYYAERITLAGETRDASIKAIEDEEKVKLASLDKQKQAEIDAVNTAKDAGVISADEASKKLIEIDTKYAKLSQDITQKSADDKVKIENGYKDNVAELKKEQAEKEDEIERQKFEAQKEMMISQILMQGLLAEAALLPYYSNPLTLPYAIGAAIAIGVATGAMIVKASGMSYKSKLSAYSPVGWGYGGPAPAGSGGDLSTPTPEIPIVINKAPYNGQVATASNTAGPDGHEMPIENIYDTNGDYLYSVYGYDDKKVDDGNGGTMTIKMPRTTPNFFQGSDFVDIENKYPSGIDTVPAMVNKGERILPTAMNQAIGGKDTTNEELVTQSKIGQFVIKRMPSLVDMMTQNGMLPLNMNYQTSSNTDERLLEEIKNVVSAIKKQPKSSTNIHVDQYNVTVQENYEQMRIRYKNQQYSRRIA